MLLVVRVATVLVKVVVEAVMAEIRLFRELESEAVREPPPPRPSELWRAAIWDWLLAMLDRTGARLLL